LNEQVAKQKKKIMIKYKKEGLLKTSKVNVRNQVVCQQKEKSFEKVVSKKGEILFWYLLLSIVLTYYYV
jgi:hypothetical protein